MKNVPALIMPGLVVALLAALSGCSARQDIVLTADGSGETELHIELDPVFSEYLADLTGSLGSDGTEPASIFDLDLVRQSFEVEPGLRLRSVHSSAPEQLHLVVEFDSLAAIFAMRHSRLAGAFRFERTDTLRRLAVRIDRRAVESMVALAGIDPFVSDSLLPPEGGMSAAEYRDFLVWALEEYGDDRPLATVISDSAVQTRVTPSGSLQEVRGGRRTGGTAVFNTPLIEAVTTRQPLEYSLIFVP